MFLSRFVSRQKTLTNLVVGRCSAPALRVLMKNPKNGLQETMIRPPQASMPKRRFRSGTAPSTTSRSKRSRRRTASSTARSAAGRCSAAETSNSRATTTGGQVYFFTDGKLKAVSLFAPVSLAHFKDEAAAVRKSGMTPAVFTDHKDKVAFDFFQAKVQSKSMAAIDRDLAEKETELLKGKKVGYVFIDAA